MHRGRMMKRIFVNQSWLMGIWVELGEGKAEMERELGAKNAGDPAVFALVIDKYIRPFFEWQKGIAPHAYWRLKETFRYALNFWSDKVLWHAIHSSLVMCHIPDPVREFYTRVWEALFPGESWAIQNKEAYEEGNEFGFGLWDKTRPPRVTIGARGKPSSRQVGE